MVRTTGRVKLGARVAAGLAAVAIAGCGASSDGAGRPGNLVSPSAPPGGQVALAGAPKATSHAQSTAANRKKGERAVRAASRQRRHHARARTRARGQGQSKHRAKRVPTPIGRRQATKPLPKAPTPPVAKRRQAVTASGRALLQVLGFKGAGLRLDKTARVLTVTIPTQEACSARPSDESAIRARFKKGFPFLRTVNVTVAGSGQGLGAYITANCKPVELPEASGQLVYSQDGKGSAETGAFQVKAKKWTVVYENDGGYFQVFVMKDDEMDGNFIVSQERGTGSKAFEGGPGAYKLRISASGAWRIKVFG